VNGRSVDRNWVTFPDFGLFNFPDNILFLSEAVNGLFLSEAKFYFKFKIIYILEKYLLYGFDINFSYSSSESSKFCSGI
jgi:hypothetical protein